jgi:hypothetical protein
LLLSYELSFEFVLRTGRTKVCNQLKYIKICSSPQ